MNISVDKIGTAINHPLETPGHHTYPKTTPVNAAKVEVTTPSPERIFFNKLQAASAEQQAVALHIREVATTMDTIGANLQKMQESLEIIVKSYPPYPQDSSERVQMLRQFGGLRRLIDQLTLPPPDDLPSRILGDEKTNSDAGDWAYIAKSGDTVRIAHQPLHTASGGLDIPDLPENAPDNALHSALERLSQAVGILNRRRDTFLMDANRVITAML